jgi:hypothetical protein
MSIQSRMKLAWLSAFSTAASLGGHLSAQRSPEVRVAGGSPRLHPQTTGHASARVYDAAVPGSYRQMGVTDDETMSEEKMNESKSTAPDDLTKTKKNRDVELTEQDLQNVSGGGAGVLSVSNTVPNLTY